MATNELRCAIPLVNRLYQIIAAQQDAPSIGFKLDMHIQNEEPFINPAAHRNDHDRHALSDEHWETKELVMEIDDFSQPSSKAVSTLIESVCQLCRITMTFANQFFTDSIKYSQAQKNMIDYRMQLEEFDKLYPNEINCDSEEEQKKLLNALPTLKLLNPWNMDEAYTPFVGNKFVVQGFNGGLNSFLQSILNGDGKHKEMIERAGEVLAQRLANLKNMLKICEKTVEAAKSGFLKAVPMSEVSSGFADKMTKVQKSKESLEAHIEDIESRLLLHRKLLLTYDERVDITQKLRALKNSSEKKFILALKLSITPQEVDAMIEDYLSAEGYGIGLFTGNLTVAMTGQVIKPGFLDLIEEIGVESHDMSKTFLEKINKLLTPENTLYNNVEDGEKTCSPCILEQHKVDEQKLDKFEEDLVLKSIADKGYSQAFAHIIAKGIGGFNNKRCMEIAKGVGAISEIGINDVDEIKDKEASNSANTGEETIEIRGLASRCISTFFATDNHYLHSPRKIGLEEERMLKTFHPE